MIQNLHQKKIQHKKIDKPIIIFISHFLLAPFPLPSIHALKNHWWESSAELKERTRKKYFHTALLSSCVHVAKINIGTIAIASITNTRKSIGRAEPIRWRKTQKINYFIHSYIYKHDTFLPKSDAAALSVFNWWFFTRIDVLVFTAFNFIFASRRSRMVSISFNCN